MAETGVILSEEETQILFDLMDSNGSGHLDLLDLVMAVTPPDYPGGAGNYHWRKRTNEMEQEYMAACAEGPGAGLRQFMKEMEAKHQDEWSLSLEETIERIQAKLEQRTPGGEKHLRMAYRMFDRKKGGGGISQDEFRIACAEMGFVLTKEDVAKFYQRHDKDKDGKLNMIEFGQAMAPPAGIAPRSLCRDVLPVDSEMPTATNADNERRRQEAPLSKCGCGEFQSRKPPNPPYQSVARMPMSYGSQELEVEAAVAREVYLQKQEKVILKRESSLGSSRARPLTARSSRTPVEGFEWVVLDHETGESPSGPKTARMSQAGQQTPRQQTPRQQTPRQQTPRQQTPMSMTPRAPSTRPVSRAPSTSPYAPAQMQNASRAPSSQARSRAARPATARPARVVKKALSSQQTNQCLDIDELLKLDAIEDSARQQFEETKARRPMSARPTTGTKKNPEAQATSWLTVEQIQTARRESEVPVKEQTPSDVQPTPANKISKGRSRRPETARTSRTACSIASSSSWVGPY